MSDDPLARARRALSSCDAPAASQPFDNERIDTLIARARVGAPELVRAPPRVRVSKPEVVRAPARVGRPDGKWVCSVCGLAWCFLASRVWVSQNER